MALQMPTNDPSTLKSLPKKTCYQRLVLQPSPAAIKPSGFAAHAALLDDTSAFPSASRTMALHKLETLAGNDLGFTTLLLPEVFVKRMSVAGQNYWNKIFLSGGGGV